MFDVGNQRRNDNVTLYLSEAHPPPPVPFELHGSISPDDWAIRLRALTKLTARYHKPVFERVWFIVAVLFTIVLPLALYRPVVTSLHYHGTKATKTFFALSMSFFIFLGAILLFWIPIVLWKRIGRHRVDALLASYATADKNANPTDSVPKWKVTTPGVFSTNTILTITMAPRSPVTSFHPDAYLPVFIGKAEEAQGAYYYPYDPVESQKAGLPRMSVVGGYGAVAEKA